MPGTLRAWALCGCSLLRPGAPVSHGPCGSDTMLPAAHVSLRALHPVDAGPHVPRTPHPWLPCPRSLTSPPDAMPRSRTSRLPAPPPCPGPARPGPASQVSWNFASRDARAGAGPRPLRAANGRPGAPERPPIRGGWTVPRS